LRPGGTRRAFGCGFTCAVDAQFTRKKAAQELARYRKSGPGITTKLLREGLERAGLTSGTLLDVGAGVGALTFELLDRGIDSAVAVDAAAPYLAAAKEEAARRERRKPVSFVHGDFVSLASTLAAASVVTLDRVVCCYPEYEPLLNEAVRHATDGIALSYPSDRWFVRLGVRIENGMRRLRANPFRTFVHPAAELERMIRAAGFDLVSRNGTATWCADVFARTSQR
jgi:magnesium-protoporphyrin O-methyltransferase